MKFVALDFETASERPDSACQIGLAVYEDGELVHEVVQLIRPPSMYFSPRCVAVHGITPSDVRDAPAWDSVWEDIQSYLEAYPIIAHNAAFDLNVLCASMSTYGLQCPYMEYSCSRLIARRAWPGRTSYALKSIADVLGLKFQHHDALEDAKVCGTIVLAAASDAEASTLEDMESTLAIDRGRVQFGVRISPKSKSKRVRATAERGSSTASLAAENAEAYNSDRAKLKQPDIVASNVARAILKCCDGVKPLSGKQIVLSGRLLGLDRLSAVAFLEQLGGSVQSKINLSTHYVVVGTSESATNRDDASELSSQQLSEVEQRGKDGQAIRILSQRQLLALIPGGSAVARSVVG